MLLNIAPGAERAAGAADPILCGHPAVRRADRTETRLTLVSESSSSCALEAFGRSSSGGDMGTKAVNREFVALIAER